MELMWLKEALFAGMTSNGFKLGTVLTLGWFWSRIAGCSVLFRGSSMASVDFVNILAANDVDTQTISPPEYVAHNNSTTYFYVLRRANNCGDLEHTLAAAVRVSIDADGNLVLPQPNDIFEARANQVAGNKVQLLWHYCPVDQELEPACFNVYYDGRTGQIDYETCIATINYVGRVFYSYQSDALDAGRYLFAIRAEDADGTENSSLAQLEVHLDTSSPASIEVLSAEAV